MIDADGIDVADGETAEMIVHGETVMKRYWNKPDGYIIIVDRLKNMILTGGCNVYSLEVENTLVGPRRGRCRRGRPA